MLCEISLRNFSRAKIQVLAKLLLPIGGCEPPSQQGVTWKRVCEDQRMPNSCEDLPLVIGHGLGVLAQGATHLHLCNLPFDGFTFVVCKFRVL